MYAEGNVGAGGCTDTEYKTHFALWCIASSPLMIGCDIRKINDTTLNLLKNKNLIRINQDEEGRPPMVVFNYNEGKRLGLVKVLSDNEFAVMLVNLDDSPSGMHMWLEDIGLPAAAGKGLRLKDAFTDEDKGVIKEKLCQEVAPHDCALYLAKIVDV